MKVLNINQPELGLTEVGFKNRPAQGSTIAFIAVPEDHDLTEVFLKYHAFPPGRHATVP